MNISEIAERTSGTVIVSAAAGDVTRAYTGDLLSDVMGHAGDASVLITVQNHLNTIAVCSLSGIDAIVVCHSREIPADMKEAAEREDIGIVSSPMSQFEASVALKDLAPSAK